MKIDIFSGSLSGRGLKSAVASIIFFGGVNWGFFGSYSSGATRKPVHSVLRFLYGIRKPLRSQIARAFLPFA